MNRYFLKAIVIILILCHFITQTNNKIMEKIMNIKESLFMFLFEEK